MSGKEKSIVVLSGGQDSATCLIKAAEETDVVGTIHFKYGQKHSVESECAAWWANRYNVPFQVVDIEAFGQIGNSNLLKGSGDVRKPHPSLAHLPSSFVPGRNLVFLTLSAAYAMKQGATQVWTGVCEADDAGYPDTRSGALVAQQKAIQLGMDFPDFRIKAPLLKKDKGDTWYMAEQAGMQYFVKYLTHTCYNGDHTTLQYYGFGCDECPSCVTRREGYDMWLKRYHSGTWETFKEMRAKQGNNLDIPDTATRYHPWWTSVENLTDNLKGINTAVELPISSVSAVNAAEDEYVVNN